MQNWQKIPSAFLLASAVFLAVGAAAVSAAENVPMAGDPTGVEALPEAATPQIEDAISDAELQDLQTIASQSGMPLQAAIDRYAWNDNFAIAVARFREAFPDAFAGAEIVDASRAWIAFAAEAPEASWEIIDAFRSSHESISIDVRTELGFTESELQKAIEGVHFAVFAMSEVHDALTSYDYATGQITTIVVMESTVAGSDPDDLRAVAMEALTDQGLAGILDGITVSVVLSDRSIIGGSESNTEHLGGELVNGGISCTSGFGTKTSTGVRGISTAGHCSNPLTDDGASLTYKAGYEGTHGDFQWHTGPQAEGDDFYSGAAAVTEANRRDVSSVGSPVVDQSLCRNGRTSHKDCQDVRKVNVCHSVYCNLVQMDAHLSADGDSGGPVYFGNTAYGIHQGYHYDIWPFDRELFSRADRIDNALNLTIATS